MMKIENLNAAYESKKRLDLISAITDSVKAGRCGDMQLSVMSGKIRLGVELDTSEMRGFLEQLEKAETDRLLALGVSP